MGTDLLSVRFPEGSTEFTFAAHAPRVGDRLKRGDQEWVVLAVETDANGNTVVSLGPADGKTI
jgi:hypothetical protein